MNTTLLTAIIVSLYPLINSILNCAAGLDHRIGNWAVVGCVESVIALAAIFVMKIQGARHLHFDANPSIIVAVIVLAIISFCSGAWGALAACISRFFSTAADWSTVFLIGGNITYVIMAAAMLLALSTAEGPSADPCE